MRGVLLGKVLLLIGIFLLASGCGGSSNKKAVSGKVTFGGKQLDTGTIEFTPVESGKSPGGSAIVNGEYSIAADKGLEVGNYKVTITSPDTSKVKAEPGGTGGEIATPERIPKQYSDKTQTKLKAEVTATGPNTFDFPLDK